MVQQTDRYPRRIHSVTHKRTPEGFVLVQVPARHIRGYVNVDAFEVLAMCCGTIPISTMIERISHEWEVAADRARTAINSALSYLELIQVIELADSPGPSAPLHDRNRNHSNFNHLYIQLPGPCRYSCPGCLIPGSQLSIQPAVLTAQAIDAGILGVTLYGPKASSMLSPALTQPVVDNGIGLAIYDPHGIDRAAVTLLAGCPGSTVILPLSTPSADDPMTVAFVQSAAQLASTGIRLSVRTIVNRIDPDALLELIAFCAQCGASEIRLRPSWDLWPLAGTPAQGMRQAIEHVQNELFARELPVPDIVIADICHIEPDYFACGAGLSSLWVRSNGIVTPCHYIDLGLGNVTTESLAEVWTGLSDDPQFHRLASAPSQCTACSFHDRCQGGCSAARLAAGGLDRPDPGRCEMFGRTEEVS